VKSLSNSLKIYFSFVFILFLFVFKLLLVCNLQVINSCTNLDELGFPSLIVSYNAKPVLIRRTGSIFRGENYMEMNIHVHKFANVAKQSIHLLSSRCGQLYMQIGFVIEGREDKELPENLFACVAINRPQEDQAEFIFDD
jgi:hypothetical protein